MCTSAPNPAVEGEGSNAPLLADADVDENHEAKAKARTSRSAPRQPAVKAAQDEMSIMGIPRETIEEMMRAWSRILIQGLKKEGLRIEGERGGDVELGEIRPRAEATPTIANRRQGNHSRIPMWNGEEIEVMSEEEIKEEDRWREARWREELVEGQRMEVETDHWKQLFYTSDEPPAYDPRGSSCTPRKWPGTREEMLAIQRTLQFLLYDGNIDSSPKCWMAFVGFQVQNICNQIERSSSNNPRLYIVVLCEYLWLIRANRSHKITINDWFYKCVRRGILSWSWDTGDRIEILLLSLKCFDILGVYDWSSSPRNRAYFRTAFREQSGVHAGLRYGQNDVECSKKRAVIICIRPSELNKSEMLQTMQRPMAIRKATPFSVGEATGNLFSWDEFRGSLLRSIGKVEFEWTTRLDEHLVLFKHRSSGVPTLKLSWFEFPPRGYLDWGEAKDRHFEARATWRLLIGPDQMDGNLQWYKDIRSPPWYCCQDTQPDPAKLPVNQMLYMDVKGRFDNPLLFSSGHISFADYPHFEKRLRELKHYMDLQAPTGLRGLWRDKRNSYSFYTLWLVVIFGGVSILLALASLVVSSLQTWAAFHPPGN